jgi:hypothetical protein
VLQCRLGGADGSSSSSSSNIPKNALQACLSRLAAAGKSPWDRCFLHYSPWGWCSGQNEDHARLVRAQAWPRVHPAGERAGRSALVHKSADVATASHACLVRGVPGAGLVSGNQAGDRQHSQLEATSEEAREIVNRCRRKRLGVCVDRIHGVTERGRFTSTGNRNRTRGRHDASAASALLLHASR